MFLVQQPIKTVYGLKWDVEMKENVVIGVNPYEYVYNGPMGPMTMQGSHYKKVPLVTLLNIAEVQSHHLHVTACMLVL